MIRSISIKGFRSYKDVQLELDKGINIIVGSSGGGKTNILRALNWVINNRPSGDSYRNRTGGDTKVEIKVRSNTVQRIKDKKTNSYVIGFKDGETEYKAMGTDVPDDIKKLLNMTDINIQNQHNAPFLLSESAGEVGRYLNKLVNLDIIDTSMKTISAKKRELNSDYNHFLSELNSTIEEQSKYNWVAEAEQKVIELNRLDFIIQRNKDEIDRLLTFVKNINEIQTSINELNYINKADNKINSLIEIEKKIVALKKERGDLTDLEMRIKQADNMIGWYKDRIKESEKEFKILMPEICPLCGK